MISVYIREQKRYAPSTLQALLKDSQKNFKKIVNALKNYGVLKVVKRTKEEQDLSELSAVDEIVGEIDVSSDAFYYVFNYVGLILVDGYLLCCYPKYLFSYDNMDEKDRPKETLKQILKVLQRYKSKEQEIYLYTDSDIKNSFSRLSLFVALLDDYFQYGLCTNDQDVIELNGHGEIDWNRTINLMHPLWQNGDPYYINFLSRHTVTDDTDFIQRIHECLLSSCTQELENASILDLLDLSGAYITDTTLDDLGETEYIRYRLESELAIQFNTRKQYLIRLMIAIVDNIASSSREDSINFLGTNSFNLVWEKVCAEVFDSQLNEPLSNLQLPNMSQGDKKVINYMGKCTLKDLIEKPRWCNYDESISVRANDTLIPDIISLDIDKHIFAILDAKYYTMTLKPDGVKNQPGIGDVNKQYLYQLAYQSFIKDNHFNEVKNAFLMPTEKKEVVKVGSVHMDMLDNLGLSPIQVRELPACALFDAYLHGQKWDLAKLDL